MSIQKLVNTGERRGGFNEAPEGWEEITEKEFVQSDFFIYTWEAFEFKQLDKLADGTHLEGPILPVKLFWMNDGTGYGISSDYWKGKIRFFRFGCRHDYRGMGVEECRERGISHFGRCYHVSECRKCGYVHAVDSSD